MSFAAWAQPVEGALEEIIVTAQRRAERLQETPIAITALDAEALRARGLADIRDVGAIAPNVDISFNTNSGGGTSNAAIYIRGIGQRDFLITTDPGVGIYIDGVFFPRSTGALLDLVDIGQVEILRGPQGTLYGRNTIGGAINITTPEPGQDLTGRTELTYGSFDHYEVKQSLNFPGSEKFAVRVSGAYKTADGYVKRVIAEDTLGGYDTLVGRLRATAHPSDKLTVDFTVDGTRKRDDSAAQYNVQFVQTGNLVPLYLAPFITPVINRPTSATGSAAVNAYIATYGRQPVLVNSNNPRVSFATGPNVSDIDMWGAAGTIAYAASDALELKSITGYREFDATFGRDGDNTPYQYIQTLNNVDHKQFSEELQVNGSGMDDRLKVVSGLYYFHERAIDTNQVRLASGLFNGLESLPAAIIPLAPVACPAPLPAPCAGGKGNPVNIGLDLDFSIYNRISTNSYAAFAHATYDFSDVVSGVAGLRYTEDKKTYFLKHDRVNAGVPIIPGTTVKRSDDNLSPKVGLNFKIDENTLTYASISRGFKSGGFNGRPTTTAEVSSFGPEKVLTYEVGLKTDILDQRMRLNVAGFWNDYTDMQLNRVSADSTGNLVLVVENAGDARVRGLEMEYSIRPAGGLMIDGSVGYLDAEFRKIATGASVTLNSKLEKTPTWTVTTGVGYTFTTGSLITTLRGDWRYRAKTYNDADNTASIVQPGYSVFDVRLTVEHEDNGWSLAAYGKNVSDKRYIENGIAALSSFGEVEATLARPREWGVTAGYKF